MIELRRVRVYRGGKRPAEYEEVEAIFDLPN